MKILLLFGGESSEHEVSVSSAKNVYDALDKSNYEISLGYISRDGELFSVDTVDDYASTDDLASLMPILGKGYFESTIGDKKIAPAVILPVLHGTNGEDGTVQGLAELLHIPIVGCGVTSSAVCMDKDLTKQLLEHNEIATSPYMVHLASEPTPDAATIFEKLGNPVFVKPARNGSSVGVSKVTTGSELESALAGAHTYDDKVLIEKGINARELEVAMLGSGSTVRASSIGEIIPDGEFYSYESKYSASSQTKTNIPADIPDKLSSDIQDIAKRVYNILGCAGLARIDFFLSDDGTVYVNEINTFPGFTDISMYPKLWEHSGLTQTVLLDELIKLATK